MNPAHLLISNYHYDLPREKIAMHPLPERDHSKLLIYQNGNIQEDRFFNIQHYLPEGTLLIFNNTRVINARLRFKKNTGADIEIFCLEPNGSITDYASVLSQTGSSTWKCLVGAAAKWKEETLTKHIVVLGQEVKLQAQKISRDAEAFIIQFSWEPKRITMAAILEADGDVPLPPYIKRHTVEEDKNRYQTVFATQEGSVAAPTAGLHFTQPLLSSLGQKHIKQAFVTLHVGAGTFKPVSAVTMEGHEMHAEYIDVSIADIEQIKNQQGSIAAVGTTSLRTLESLYWLGVKATINPSDRLQLSQWEVYETPLSETALSRTEALEALLGWLRKNKLARIFTQTQILIAPSYRFRVADILFTNFHQPQSTLLLLVAAAVGDKWKQLYDYALEHDFRFLSYGDANLIFIHNPPMAGS